MDTTEQVREFLTTRRARLTPEQAGLPAWGGHRRVTGLRREEVAMLSGMSVDYYTRLERGNLTGTSEQVLSALAEALQLDEAERMHLADLARAANAGPSRRAPRAARPPRGAVRREVQWMLDSMQGVPAMVRNDRRDIVATNTLGRALYSELYRDPVRPANLARFTFLDPRARDFFMDWDRSATDLAASLRTAAGRTPDDRILSSLIGELTTRSTEFSRMWAAHDVRLHRSGSKRMRHPVVGELTLTYESMDLPGDPGHSLIVYTAEPASTSAANLLLLAGWAEQTRAEASQPGQDDRSATRA